MIIRHHAEIGHLIVGDHRGDPVISRYSDCHILRHNPRNDAVHVQRRNDTVHVKRKVRGVLRKRKACSW